MTEKKKNFGVPIVALIFTFLGLVIVFDLVKNTFWVENCISNFRLYSDTDTISDTPSKVCYCAKGAVVCDKKSELEVLNKDLEISDFVRTNLGFEAQYIATGVAPDLDSKLLKTDVMSIKQGNKSLEVILRQGQLCSKNNRAPVQIGLFNFSNEILTLMNVVNTLESLYTQPCTVQLTYAVSNISINPQSNFKLQFMSEDGEIVPAQLCIYQGKIYNENDNYVAKDACNICKCVNGISKCSTDRVCSK